MDDKNTLEVFSAKITLENKKALAQLKEDGGFPSMNSLIDTLIERYNNPIQLNKSYEQQIDKLNMLLEQANAEKATIAQNLDNLIRENQETVAQHIQEIQVYKQRIADLDEEVIQMKTDITEAINSGKLPENHHAIHIDPLNWLILQYVAERESKTRKQDWTVHDVINYFLHFRFEKGALNGDLNSVPDSEIRRMKLEIAEKE